MTRTWTYNADGSYQVAWAGVTGEPYTAFTVQHAANGQLTTASYNNGMTATWTYNPDGSYDGAYQNATGFGYSSFENVHNAAGVLVATAEDMTDGSGDLLLFTDGLTVSSSSGQLSVTTGRGHVPSQRPRDGGDLRHRARCGNLRVRLRLRPELDYGPLGGRRRERCDPIQSLDVQRLEFDQYGGAKFGRSVVKRRGGAIRRQRDDHRFSSRRLDPYGRDDEHTHREREQCFQIYLARERNRSVFHAAKTMQSRIVFADKLLRTPTGRQLISLALVAGLSRLRLSSWRGLNHWANFLSQSNLRYPWLTCNVALAGC